MAALIRSTLLNRLSQVLFAGMALILAGPDLLWAQPGGRGPGGFLDRYDQNGDRTLDSSELQQIQGPFRGFIESSGVDMSRSISLDDLSERMRRRGEEMRAERERGSAGANGSSDGRDGFRGRDFRRESEGDSHRSDDSDRRGRDYRGNESGSHAASNDPNTRNSKYSAKPKSLVRHERITVGLPSQYSAGDADRDGQIALSEWKTWKGRAGLSEFLRLDRDGDGFLTPRELQSTVSASPAAGTIAAAPAPVTPTAASPTESTLATPVTPAAPAGGTPTAGTGGVTATPANVAAPTTTAPTSSAPVSTTAAGATKSP